MTYDEAVRAYINSSWFTDLSSKTQEDYLYHIEYMRKLLPNTIQKVTPILTNTLYVKVKTERGERTANYVCSVMRRMWNFLYRMELTNALPWSNMGIKSTLKPRGVVWKRADVFTVIDQKENLNVALMVALMYDTAQRPSDILKATWEDIKEGVLTVEQSKTGETVRVPLNVSLKLLESLPYKEGLLIKTKTGLKYHLTNMNKEFNILRNKLGLSNELQLRDLRRTVLTELGNAGATEDEIIAVSGHKSRQVVAHYVKKTETQAANAMIKRGL